MMQIIARPLRTRVFRAFMRGFSWHWMYYYGSADVDLLLHRRECCEDAKMKDIALFRELADHPSPCFRS